jgi:hypothetical protein
MKKRYIVQTLRRKLYLLKEYSSRLQVSSSNVYAESEPQTYYSTMEGTEEI